MGSPVALTGTGNVTSVQDTDITGAETLNVPKPANIANNEILCIAINGRNASLTWDVVPSGFTAWKHVNNSGTLSLYAKKIRNAGGEPSTYDFSPSAGAGRCGALAFRVSLSNVGNAFGAAGANEVNTDIAPSVTPPSIDNLLLGVYVTYGSSAMVLTPPTGMTIVGDVSIGASSSWSRLMVCQQSLTTATATGTRTAGVSSGSPTARNNFLATVKPEILGGSSLGVSARSGSGFGSERRLLAQQLLGVDAVMSAEGDIIMGAPEGAMAMTSRAGMSATAKAIRDGGVILSSKARMTANPAYGLYNTMDAEGNWRSVPIRELVDGVWE